MYTWSHMHMYIIHVHVYVCNMLLLSVAQLIKNVEMTCFDNAETVWQCGVLQWISSGRGHSDDAKQGHYWHMKLIQIPLINDFCPGHEFTCFNCVPHAVVWLCCWNCNELAGGKPLRVPGRCCPWHCDTHLSRKISGEQELWTVMRGQGEMTCVCYMLLLPCLASQQLTCIPRFLL